MSSSCPEQARNPLSCTHRSWSHLPANPSAITLVKANLCALVECPLLLPVLQYIFKVFCTKNYGEGGGDKTLKVGQLNLLLDSLVEKPKVEEKADILRELMHLTTAEQMKFIVHIILGDLKVSMVAPFRLWLSLKCHRQRLVRVLILMGMMTNACHGSSSDMPTCQ